MNTITSKEADARLPKFATAPSTREKLLAATESWRREIYLEVRRVLDEVEAAAPWRLLYYPPDDAPTFLRMVDALIEVVSGIPGRLGGLLDRLRKEGWEDNAAFVETRFYFTGIHGMIEHDLGRLQEQLEIFSGSDLQPNLEQRQRLCELASDLKGKYSSALMGATASIVSGGRWNGVEVEPVLFPEKADEFSRNSLLVERLDDLVKLIRRLPTEVPFVELKRAWSECQQVDLYALADLTVLRGQLGRLLQEENRRALYSGDYHEIRRRESRLSQVLNRLEAVHAELWRRSGSRAGPEKAYRELILLLEQVAALVDVEILRQLIGKKAVRDLRARVERSAASSQVGSQSNSQEEHLVSLMGDDDLKMFLELLRGAVSRRASLLVAQRPVRPAAHAVERLEVRETSTPKEAEGSAWEAPKVRGRGEVLSSIGDLAPEEEVGRLSGPGGEDADQRELLLQIQRSLDAILSGSNPANGTFRMIHRLLSKHATIPPSMFQATRPFVDQLVHGLIPDLSAAAAKGAIPSDLAPHLEALCRPLGQPQVTAAELMGEIPNAMGRTLDLIDALKSTLDTLLKGRV